MGRYRVKNRHLPPRLHARNGNYYHVTLVDGRRAWTPLGRDYGQALTKWAELEKSALPTGRLFEDLAREFQLRVVPGWKEKTQKIYPYWQGPLLDTFSGVDIADIKATHIYGHVQKRAAEGFRASGLRERSVLSSMLGKAVEWGWLNANPALGVRMKQEATRGRYLKDTEYAALYAAGNDVVKIAMEIGYLTGLRIGDILALRKDAIAEGALWVLQEKNQVQAKYTLSPQLKAAIAKAKLRGGKASEYLLARRNGQPYAYSGFRSMWVRALAKAGVPDAHFHDIRGKAATDAKAQGRDVQDFTRHKSPEQAAKYAKVKEVPTIQPLRIGTAMRKK